jgi:NAD(P)-dependent dehydrogenase (short-subunit alcohol dehydrogenase family)
MGQKYESIPVLVTGGSSGIGAAIAEEFVRRGARVQSLSTSGRAPDGVMGIACDVGDPPSMANAFEEIGQRFPEGLAHVVCSTGVVSEHPIDELEPDEWRRVLDASLTGTYLTLHHAVPLMRRHGGGSVVCMSSGWAKRGYPRGAHYAAAKGGIESLVRSLALELAPDRIRVNSVSPGPVTTPMLDDLPDFDADERSARIPLGRLGTVEDIVNSTFFLLGDGADHITGQVLQVSGGLTI